MPSLLTNQQRDNYSRDKRMAVRFRLIGAVPLDIRDLGRYFRYQRRRLCRVNSGHLFAPDLREL